MYEQTMRKILLYSINNNQKEIKRILVKIKGDEIKNKLNKG